MKSQIRVALLTAGRDKPYAYGMATALISQAISLDIIGGDDLDGSQWYGKPRVRFLNLRGDMRENTTFAQKVSRVLTYYVRLLLYATTARPKIFHILWNNKFETFDRVPLMLYYRLLGKKIVLTVHNVNSRTRDSNDTWLNRLTLKIQYRLADHLFVHTQRMKTELVEQFGVQTSTISVVPFGINNAVPNTDLTDEEARRRLDLASNDRTILFFGNIAPYKGLEFLVNAFRQIMEHGRPYRLIIVGNPKKCDAYWNDLQEILRCHPNRDRIVQCIEYIPDDQTEVYFKAADVLVLPYRYIYQSGVLFLGYSFGLPVIATEVGSLKEEIIEGKTGFISKPEDSTELAKVIENYFSSDLYRNLKSHRQTIRDHALQRYSWQVVGELTSKVYEGLVGKQWTSKGCQLVPR